MNRKPRYPKSMSLFPLCSALLALIPNTTTRSPATHTAEVRTSRRPSSLSPPAFAIAASSARSRAFVRRGRRVWRRVRGKREISSGASDELASSRTTTTSRHAPFLVNIAFLNLPAALRFARARAVFPPRVRRFVRRSRARGATPSHPSRASLHVDPVRISRVVQTEKRRSLVARAGGAHTPRDAWRTYRASPRRRPRGSSRQRTTRSWNSTTPRPRPAPRRRWTTRARLAIFLARSALPRPRPRRARPSSTTSSSPQTGPCSACASRRCVSTRRTSRSPAAPSSSGSLTRAAPCDTASRW